MAVCRLAYASTLVRVGIAATLASRGDSDRAAKRQGAAMALSNLLFRGPTWKEIKDPSPFCLHQLLTNPPRGVWAQGSGDATLEYEATSGDEISLLILPNEEFGIYLKYHRRKGGRIVETWLSLHDATRLGEVTTCSDEWFASVGLFLPIEAAAHAVEEFARSGRRSDAIRWITEAEIPETGNS